MSPERESIHLLLRPLPPFRLDWTVWALRRRSFNAVDQWNGSTYRRAVVLEGRPALVAVSQPKRALEVTVTGQDLPASAGRQATKLLERVLGLRVDLSEFYELSSMHARLSALAIRFRGMKPPCFPTIFEGLVNAISCQQLSLTVGILLLNRLSERCGLEAQDGIHAFPQPEELAGLDAKEMRAMGYSGNKSRALIELAEAVASGRLDLEKLMQLNNAQCVERLTAIRGVGRWTAEYVLLRAMGRTDMFPCDDVGARNSLERWLHLRKKLDYNRTRNLLSRWKKYSGLIFFHLLLNGLEEAEDLNAATLHAGN